MSLVIKGILSFDCTNTPKSVNEVGKGMVRSKIFRPKPRLLRDLGERSRTNLLAVVKAKGEVGAARALELSMRTHLLPSVQPSRSKAA
jgi:hypothetical protein